MDLVRCYANIGSVLISKIACDYCLDAYKIGREFIDLNFNAEFIEDELPLFARELSYGLYNKQVLKWFFESKLLSDFTVMHDLTILTDSVRINYSLYRGCDKAYYTHNGSLVPFDNYRLAERNLSSFTTYFDQFVHIDSFVSINPGSGKRELEKAINGVFAGRNICLTAGFMFKGDYDYWMNNDDGLQMSDIVRFYEDLGFKNINAWCEGNDTSVAMMLVKDKSAILNDMGRRDAFWCRLLGEMSIF